MVNKRLSYLIKFIYSPVDDNMHIKRRELIKDENSCTDSQAEKKRSIKPSEMRIVKRRYQE